jgi:hypothetical protein
MPGRINLFIFLILREKERKVKKEKPQSDLVHCPRSIPGILDLTDSSFLSLSLQIQKLKR